MSKSFLALNDLSSLLSRLGKSREVDKLTHLADKTIHGVEEKLWSEQDGCYIDIQESLCIQEQLL